MKKVMKTISLGLLLLLAGCIPSLHPLYTEDDLVTDPLLVGVWADKDGKITWTFTENGENAYTLDYADEDGQNGQFAVHLLKLGDRQFLDLYPADPDLQQNVFYNYHLLPIHTFMRVERQGDSLRMAVLKRNWIKRYLKEHPKAIKHEAVDEGILLTAQPKDLQAFLRQLDKRPDAWDECCPMTRRVEGAKSL